MWLNDDVESASPDKTVCARERYIHGPHNLGNANCGTSGDTNSAVDQSGRAVSSSAIYIEREANRLAKGHIIGRDLAPLLTNKFEASGKLVS